jgi:acetyl-CoA carboxylase carboxyltransferase component
LPVLETRIDTGSATFAANREKMLERLEKLEEEQGKARLGGGEKRIERHHSRGRLMPRERIEMLLDRDSPFLEIGALCAYGSEYEVGASQVNGIGVVEGVECMVGASDPTVRGGTSNPYTLRKNLRAQEIAMVNRLPAIGFVESGGADLPRQKEIFVPGGANFRNITRKSAAVNSETPETRECISAPPSASSSASSPVAIFTNGGPPRKIRPCSRTITV